MIATHQPLLTKRECEVLQLRVTGLNARGIAEVLQISPDTVHSHLESVRVKLNAKNTAHAAAIAWQKGLIQ